MHCEPLTLPLLDYLAYRAGCVYLSDLRQAAGWQRARLARALEQIPAEAVDLRTWNDALEYLTREPSEPTAEDARARLIAALSKTL